MDNIKAEKELKKYCKILKIDINNLSKDDWINITDKFYKEFTDNFIDMYKNYLEWVWICSHYKITNSFIEKYFKYIKWLPLSWNGKLPKTVLKNYAKHLNWNYIIKTQSVEEDIIVKNLNKIDLNILSNCQLLSKEFCKKYKIENNNILHIYYNIVQGSHPLIIHKDLTFSHDTMLNYNLEDFETVVLNMKEGTEFKIKMLKLIKHYKTKIEL